MNTSFVNVPYIVTCTAENKIAPVLSGAKTGAGEETRTLDVHLGKVVLDQLSYTRRAGWKE